MYYNKKYDEEENEKNFKKLLTIIMSLKKAKCGTVVETSLPLRGQNLKLLKRLSETLNIHIIPCTGINIIKLIWRYFQKAFPISWQTGG